MMSTNDLRQHLHAPDELSRPEVVGFCSRLMAFAIDLMLLCCFLVLSLVVTGKSVVQTAGTTAEITDLLQLVGGWLLGSLCGALVVGMSYFLLMHGLCGRTIGKKIMGIRLVSEGGDPPRIGRCFLRGIGYLISALPLFLGFCWVLLDVEGRAWHDRLAGTRVVYS